MSEPIETFDLEQRLIEVMRLELSLLREVLHLLKEEEEALLKNNQDLAKSIIKRCSELRRRLKQVQKERRVAIKHFCKKVHKDIDLHQFNSKVFEELSTSDEFGLETLNLKEQILKLNSHIDEQKKRNQKTSGTENVPIYQESPEQSKSVSKLGTIEGEGEKKAS